MQKNKFLKIFISLICLIYLSFYQTQGQGFDNNRHIDSLRKVLPALKDTGRIKCLNRLGWAYQLDNPDSSRYFLQIALRESEKISYFKGIGNAHFALARIENGLGGTSPAKEQHYLKAIDAYKRIDDKYALANAYSEIASVYRSLGKHQSAVEYYKKAISLIEKTAYSPNEIIIMYDDLSYYFQETGNYKESFDYRKKSFDLNKKKNNTFGILVGLQSFGNLFSEAGDKESADDYYEKAIDFYRSNSIDKRQPYSRLIGLIFLSLSNNDSALFYLNKALSDADSQTWANALKVNFKRFVHTDRAKVFLNSNQFEKAIECLKEPLEFYAENKDKKHVGAASLLTMGEAQFGLKNYPAALEYAKEAFHLATELKRKKDTKDASRLLWKIYDKLNNNDSAYYYLQQFLTIKEDFEKNRSSNELALFKATQKDEERQARMDLLNKENKIKEQELVIQRQNLRREANKNNFLLAGLLGLFVLGIIVFRSVLLKRKLESEKRVLAEKELQLQKLENERRITDLEMMALRSQMNPHFIFNCLNSINRFVLRNDTEAASGYLTKFSKLMRMVLENSKQVLIPLEEEVKCLELYIQMEQFRCKNSFTYYVKYHDGVNTEEAMIPPLLLQPFVENAIWHGVNPKEGDGKIGIEFFQKEETLYCVIKDNGIGRKKASELKSQLSEHHKSMGLQITKERLAIMGEKQSDESPVEIEDLYDENGQAMGTKVTIRIFSLPAFEELKPSLNL
ncbi:MAG TPA: tetratricopeptide repeat protein [Chitinophagaceae bacterium]|nr:tetratricopeptide repeat protein [Chitinophagaceae bacterium]